MLAARGCTTRSPTSRRCACTRRSRTPARSSTSSASLAPRPRARAGPLARRPSHARARCSPTTTTTPTSSSRSACSAGCGGGGADIYRPLRNALVAVNLLAFVVFWLLPGGAAADARRLHRRRRLDARDRLLAHRRARLAGQPARGDALAAHRLGGCGARSRVWQLTTPSAGCGRSRLRVPVLTGFAVLATGNHFLLDLCGGRRGGRARVAVLRAARTGRRSDAAARGCAAGALSAPRGPRARVPHVTKLLRSPRSDRLARAAADC